MKTNQDHQECEHSLTVLHKGKITTNPCNPMNRMAWFFLTTFTLYLSSLHFLPDMLITNNEKQQQFELHADCETAVLPYSSWGAIWLMHTEVPKKLKEGV
jgi:hypothetical protein